MTRIVFLSAIMNPQMCAKLIAIVISVIIVICRPQVTTGMENRPNVIPVRSPTRLVSDETVEKIYQQVKAPFKFGIVIRGEDGNAVDCPSVFQHQQKWYMVYVCMNKVGYEKIGMAVSEDMIHWIRYGQEPVVANGEEKGHGISGDPQIVKIGDVWVMFYFGAFWKPKAFDTFACSYDLVNWTKWTGPHLIEPSEPWDAQYAHKPWVIKHDGIVYHFYCAVGNEGRVIALATSKPLRRNDKKAMTGR